MDSYNGGKQQRRVRALSRLENQVKTDGYPLSFYKTSSPDVYQKQVKRINLEIENLRKKL